MEIITDLNLATAGELALSGFLIALIVQGIKSTGKVSNNFIPLVSMAIGVVIGIVAVVATHDTNYVGGAVSGLIIGAGTSGMVDLAKGTIKTARVVKTNKEVKQAKTIEKAVSKYLKERG
ncbi:hypothetical protein R0H03_03925 [Pediococcus acidilactici]|uniref:Holin n=1 Tax=Pediococcus acidilactici TaxID=1254 RepID=A0AAW8YMH4_PEDAC|nr:hypothetical protein [Pediococcus acidilactici]MDV2911013.1 hypothetical protein [Pediococcus acidilactici]WQS17663.1 hypothetical protein SGW14_01085 [Pediococcus acidilactici]